MIRPLPGPSLAGCGHNVGVALSTEVLPSRGLRPRLAYLSGFFAGGLGLSALYATAGVGLPCPFRAITGWDCPLCGGTRMGASLLDGDWQAAYAFNPAALIGLVVLTMVGVAWLVEAVGGPALRLPPGLRRRLSRVSPNQWLLVGAAAALLYVLARNLA